VAGDGLAPSVTVQKKYMWGSMRKRIKGNFDLRKQVKYLNFSVSVHMLL